MSLFKSASTVSLWTLASRLTGLARELLVASWFGASALTDAFNVAFRIPNLFRRLFAEGAFSQAFVPVLAASRESEGDAATHRLIQHVLTLLSCVLVLTCVLGVFGAPWLVWVMASGLDWTVVRPPAIYGPRDREMLELFKVAKWGFIPMPQEEGRASYIHVDDLAALPLALVPGGDGVTGHVFEASGQTLAIAEGWVRGPRTTPIDDPTQLGPVVADLLGKARKNSGMNGEPGGWPQPNRS